MEYRIAKGWRIFSVVFCVAFVIGGGVLLVIPFTGSPNAPVFLFIIGLALIAMGIFGCVDALKTKLTIDEQAIGLQRMFSSRSLLLNDIKGYRQGEKGILVIVPKEGAGKPMQLSAYLERKNELKTWLGEHYPDVDAVEYEEETRAILADEKFGVTEDERENNLARAKKIAGAANAIGIGATVWAFVYPRPYEWLLIALLLLPWIGIYIIWYFKGLVRFDARKKSAWPSVSILIYFPALALLIRCIMDYQLYLYNGIWAPVIIAGIVLLFLCLRICNKAIAEEKNKTTVMIVGALIAGCYSFGLVVFTNCYYDTSKPRTFKVGVTGKHISSGKTTTYYLTLSPWGRFSEEEDVSVGKSIYNDVQEGQVVRIHLHEGRWHIPWYFIME